MVPIGLPVAVSRVTSVRRIAAMPKSRTLTVPLSDDQDVVGLEVAVDDRDGVGVGEHGGDLRGDGHRPADRQRAGRVDVGAQGVPRRSSITRNTWSYGASSTASYTCGTPWCWMRAVMRASRRKRLANSSACSAEDDHVGADEFDGDLPVEDGVVAAPDLAHAAGADVFEEFVAAGDRLCMHWCPLSRLVGHVRRSMLSLTGAGIDGPSVTGCQRSRLAGRQSGSGRGTGQATSHHAFLSADHLPGGTAGAAVE